MAKLRAAVVLAAAAALIVGAGGAWWGRRAAIAGVERGLRRLDLQWSARQDAVAELHWHGLTGPGIQVQRLELRLLPTPSLRLTNPVVHLDALDLDALPLSPDGLQAALRAPSAVPGAAPDPLAALDALFQPLLPTALAGATAEIRGGAVYWGEDPLLTNLHGPLWPEQRLQGDEGDISLQNGVPVINLKKRIEFEWLHTAASATVSCAPPACTFALKLDELMVNDPRLAPTTLPVTALELEGSYDLDQHALQAEGRLGGLRFDLRGTLSPEPVRFDLTIDVHDAPLGALLELFGPLVPEARRGEVSGTVGLALQLSGPPLRWSARPRAAGLAASGVVPNLGELRGGRVRWTHPDASGREQAQETGEGTRGWVPYAAAGLVPKTFVAAEDAAFGRHPGYSLEAVQDAVDEAAAEGEWLQRGGSTITQQLVKNLYLDGRDRSVARKLRELLLALEVQAALPPERVLGLYINVVELGPGIFGVGAASEAYFLKRPERLTLREAAFLATLLPAPARGYRRYLAEDPPDLRIDQIIDNMLLMRAVDPATASRAKKEQLRFVPPAR